MADAQWLGNAITALATISASALTFYGAYMISKNNQKNDNSKFQKQIEWEREKLEKEINRKEYIDKLKIYNKVLKVDGEVMIVTSYPEEFDFNNYHEKVRPLLFEEYHLLDQDIKVIVREIDGIIALCNFYEEVQKEHNEKLMKLYFKLLEKIDNHYKR
ncbi:hypothetical protein DC345_00610 [Paenibacillus taichungensis]|uniref:DUF4760 domain-containing protein n=1 Tax=Paenibacillus taichungensis TaxID=484184 RepID=A0A329R838_9BACL|nr:hypothetical protein [Paenibacillus taichungensis]RAW19318.1 hypothetical protein DC345_00610 [Paenibacillus taichungensis]